MSEVLPPGIASALATLRADGYAVTITALLVSYTGDEGATAREMLISERIMSEQLVSIERKRRGRLSLVQGGGDR